MKIETCAFLMILLASTKLLAQEELVFWKAKPKLYAQIAKNRKIVVSSRVLEREGRMRILGAGLVDASIGHTVEMVQKFEKLPDVSGYFKEVKHDKKNKKVYFFIKAYGYETRFLLKYSWSRVQRGGQQLNWIIVWGRLKGMQGHFQLESFSESKTIMSTWVSFDMKKIPLPHFLMGFTLEVIAEKVAQKMRNFIEVSQPHDKGHNGKTTKS